MSTDEWRHKIEAVRRQVETVRAAAAHLAQWPAGLQEVLEVLQTSLAELHVRPEALQRVQRDEEIRTLLEINKTLAQVHELPALLDVIATEAARLLAVPEVSFRLCEGDELRLMGAWGETGTESIRPSIQRGESLSGLVVATGVPLFVNDITQEDRLLPEHRQRLLRQEYVAYLGVPLHLGAEVIGVMIFNAARTRPFTEHDRDLAVAFADQAAIAVQQARLYAQAERRRIAAESLTTLTRVLSESLDPAEVGQRIVDTVKSLVGGQGAALFQRDSRSGDLQAIALSSDSPALSHRPQFLPHGTSVAGLAVQARRPVVSLNILTDPRLTLTPALHAQLDSLPPCAILAVPLRVHDEVVGILSLMDAAGRDFSTAEIDLVEAFATNAATALRNARLHQEAQDAYRQVARTQEQFVQAQKMQAVGQMASGIAHDINNAILPITLYVESLLISEPTLSIRARTYLGTIQQAVQDVAHTVARLQEFYRQPVGLQAARPVDLSQIALQVVELTRAKWRDEPQRHGVTITMRTALQEGLPALLGVESELREALINLVFNAVDAMPDGGTLTLRTHATPTAVVVEVRDTGMGMDETTRQRCLEPFYTTKDARGTGLGLAMVYGVTERHAAEISIESAVGQGTTVRLLFPITPSPEALPAPPAEGVERVLPLRILVVDDEPQIRELLQDVLQTQGHRVTVVEGGRGALAAVQGAGELQQPFDVVITDLGMPDMDGREVARVVKHAAPGTPVILLTGWGQALQQEPSLPPHVDHLLSKPLGLRDLQAALQAVTRQRG